MIFHRIIVFTFFLVMAVTVIPVSGTSIEIGVKTGDWVKYEVLGDVPQIADYEWVLLEVQDVSGTEVKVLATVHRIDGGEETNTHTWDIETGREPWIIPANLNSGDSFSLGYNAVNVNDTLTLTYAGANRAMNLLHLVEYDENTEMTAYWDQTTGFLLELSLVNSSPGESWSGGYKALETNLWSPTSALELIWNLSSDRVTRGDHVTVQAEVRDQGGDPVEGAVVTVYIGDKAVDLIDQGSGRYQIDVDTLDIEDGAYNITVLAHKEGYESDETTGTLVIDRRVLSVSVELSAETVNKGEIITVFAEVKDQDENSVEEATVNATLGHKTIYLSDEGSGQYRGNIDTFDIDEGTYNIEVIAEKEFCESAQNTETLTVKALTRLVTYGVIAVAVIIIVLAFAFLRR
jgi:hypothetical protein